ncbi:hypothetical protein ROLI_044840 [Roseobacter fucihabitans]|uniref:Uncharacterized protein n=1 Tax=Roseobacter fucihabitans TaxID=1537242 RepID=A0ABZ2C1G0_9RHOB
MAKKKMTMGFVTAGKKSNSTSVSRSSSSKMLKSNSEVTSAKTASKVLRDPKSSPVAKTAAASALTQRSNKNIKTGTFVLGKPGKGITMKESRQRMLKQLDGSFKRLA